MFSMNLTSNKAPALMVALLMSVCDIERNVSWQHLIPYP